jgi:two-component system osmolarity sensor histidine kinase EnvZ
MKLQLAMLGSTQEAANLSSDVVEMETMIDGYLAFARGQDTEAPEAVDVHGLLHEIVSQAQRKGNEVNLSNVGPLHAVLRPNAMRRCLNNLVDNAGRFGTHVQVSASQSDDFLAITVDDDGPGIDEDHREEVFRPFFRLESSRNSETGGSGLGLSIARDVARGHGGDVVLSQSPQGGLRAEVRLPA